MGWFFTSAIFCCAVFALSRAQGVSNENFTFQLRKCCPKGTIYRDYLDICFPSPLDDSPLSNVTHQQPDGELITLELADSQGLDLCPDGFIGSTLKEFSLFTNGSAQVRTNEDTLIIDWSEYCIDQSYEHVSFLRFCSVDPCWKSEKPCVKKCCPPGEILYRDTRQCGAPQDNGTYNILTAITDEKGIAWNAANESSFTRVYGTGLKCTNDHLRQTVTSSPVVNRNGSFVNFEALIDADRLTDQYCIDYSDANDMAKGYRALACMELYPPVPDYLEQALLIYPYFHAASIVFLIITLAVYSLLPELRNIHGVLVMCLVAALTVLHSGMCVIALFGKTMPDVPCIVNAVVTHFAFLSAYAWLNVVAFDVWITFSRVGGVFKKKRVVNKQHLGEIFVYYSIYGWGLPGVITLVGQILDNIKDLPDYVIRPQFGVWTCWFYLQDSYLLYIHGPAVVMNIANVYFFVTSSVSIYCQSQAPEIRQNQGNIPAKQRLRVMFTLFVFMGIPWMSEIITFYTADTLPSTAVTDIFNILTGFMIFLLFVCKPNIASLLRKQYPRFDRLVSSVASQPVWKFITRNNSTLSEESVYSRQSKQTKTPPSSMNQRGTCLDDSQNK